jgi:glycosyltransferase involved in cell wall biosynthesis
MKVSIVIPVYNGAAYLRSAIESALAQTYKNIEVIVVNDGSNDGGQTRNIAADYLDHIKYLEQENVGVSGALNSAIAQMTGEAMTWLSHDDIFLPTKIERNVDYYKRLGRQGAIVFSDYYLIDGAGYRTEEVRLDHREFLRKPLSPLLNASINGCTVLLPRVVLDRCGPFDVTLRYTQDYAYWNSALRYFEFFHQPEALVEYRIHDDQASQAKKHLLIRENIKLWQQIVDARSSAERVLLYGSSRRFFEEMTSFLEATPWPDAAIHARAQRHRHEAPLVSVIITATEKLKLSRALHSVLVQTYVNIEVILVICSVDGLLELRDLEEQGKLKQDITVVRQVGDDRLAAMNAGLKFARGEYLAFLEADGTYVPDKLEKQIGAMQDIGALMSHTSYILHRTGRSRSAVVVASGRFTGAVYPEIIADCPIVLSTVVLHRVLISQGHTFPEGDGADEGALWIELALRHSWLGLCEILTGIHLDTHPTQWDVEAAKAKLRARYRGILQHPAHVRHEVQYQSLARTARKLRRSSLQRRFY